MRRTVSQQWAGENGRLRVLVESEDPAIRASAENALRDHAYAAASCGGPETLPRRRCPLVTEGRCPLVDGADVVVHALRAGDPANLRVLEATKNHYPGKPIVVEITGSAAARHAESLAGCKRLPFPMTRKGLLGAVGAALRDRAHLGNDR